MASDKVEKRILDDAYHHLDLGGIGNPCSTMTGGIISRMSQELSTAVLRTEYKFAVGFAMITLVLLLKPEGIIGSAK